MDTTMNMDKGGYGPARVQHTCSFVLVHATSTECGVGQHVIEGDDGFWC